MSQEPDYQFATKALHAGYSPADHEGARAVPIFQTSSYVFDSPEQASARFNLEEVGNIYSRLTNPTVSTLEARVAALEGGAGAVATSSGHAAQILALFALMEPGCNVVASRKLYGGSINQMTHAYKRFGWSVTFVESNEPEEFRTAVTPETRAIFVESLANPGGVVTDLEAVAKIADEAGVPLIVDNTMATPYLCRPIEWGATIVVDSSTKFLQGSGATIGGLVVDSGKFDWMAHADKFPSLAKPSPEYHGLNFGEALGPMAFTFFGKAVGLRDLGPCQSPQNAFLTLLGLETLGLRMDRHCENALTVASWLQSHPDVKWVSYAGLPDNPHKPMADKYLGGKGGAVFTFGLNGGYEQGINVIRNVKLISHLANIGDSRTLIIHPASSTHRQVAEDKLALAGASPEVVRLSIGLEAVDDIIADLDQAIAASKG